MLLLGYDLSVASVLSSIAVISLFSALLKLWQLKRSVR
jgi:hypothetical protein